MRFWDASAVAPLLVDERSSPAAMDLLREDASIVVWWGTRVECTSALRRREREGALGAADCSRALELLGTLAASWSELVPSEPVRVSAERALAVHPLRAADALALAAALVWRGPTAAAAEFVCLDERLRDAASREGLRVLPVAQAAGERR